MPQAPSQGTLKLCDDWPSNDPFAYDYSQSVKFGLTELISSIPSDFPSDIPLPSESKILSVTKRSDSKRSDSFYTFCVNSNIYDTYNFYIRNTYSYWNENPSAIWKTQDSGRSSKDDIDRTMQDNGGELRFSAYVPDPQSDGILRDIIIKARKASEEKTVITIIHKYI